MEYVDNLAHPSHQVMVRLIEEAIWCGTEDTDALNAISENVSKNKLYLREKVFPTLVPALYELVRRKQDELLHASSSNLLQEEMSESADKQAKIASEEHKDEDASNENVNTSKYGPSGNTDPITWLALYMIRNNANVKTTKAAHHPYNIVNSVALAHARCNLKELR